MKRSRAPLVLAACAVLACAGFAALGTWQLFRLQWKLALIDRVEHRVHAPPVPPPRPEQWPQVNAAADEYRHVGITGTFLYDQTVPVTAATELGSGFWLLTPLRGSDGNIVLVNRGFVDAAGVRDAIGRPPAAADAGTGAVVTVTGLLRMTEPGGGFLRRNDPAANRWYSRDVQAIAAARGLAHVAPYFVDADAADRPANAPLRPGEPVAGLTVVSFHNNHVAYASTWYALALMAAAAVFRILRDEKRAVRDAVRGPAGIDRDNAHDDRQGNH